MKDIQVEYNTQSTLAEFLVISAKKKKTKHKQEWEHRRAHARTARFKMEKAHRIVSTLNASEKQTIKISKAKSLLPATKRRRINEKTAKKEMKTTSASI